MSERKRILVVDDDSSIRMTISFILEEEGYIVDAVETGKEAIEKAQSNYYNLALLDYRLRALARMVGKTCSNWLD